LIDMYFLEPKMDFFYVILFLILLLHQPNFVSHQRPITIHRFSCEFSL